MLQLDQSRALKEAAIAALVVTVLVTVASIFVPKDHSGTVVGLLFLVAVWWLVWRKDDAWVTQMGLGLGGLVLSSSIPWRRVAREGGTALGWALLVATVCFVPYYFGWRFWWKPHAPFSLLLHPGDVANLVLSQVMLVGLPEEAFYRGYLQTRLDEVLPPKITVLGARIGPALLIASLVFAVGHVLTVHRWERLGVFFPSLVFGWLRSRTGGVGAGIAFHVMCNLYSEMLGKAYGVY